MHRNAKKNSTDGPSLSDRLKLQRRPILIALCDQAIVTIPTITLYMMYPNFIVGTISLAVSLLQSPTTLIATSFSTTILVELSKSSNRMKISNELLRRFLLIHILLIVLGTIIGVITGFMLASINLGSWNGISYVLIIQSLPFMLMTMWIPLSSILQSLGHWKMRLNIGYLQLITIIISMLLAKFLDLEWKSFVIIYACAIFIANIIAITKSINLIKNLVLTEET
jgi:O-antigen/teichoic acid export membrane protein